MLRLLAYSLLFVSLFSSLNVRAHVSAISAATASAGRAAIETYDVPFMNPAGIAYATGYNFATGFSRYNSLTAGDQDELAVLLSDNMPDTVVPSSLAYVQKRDLAPGSSWSQNDLRLSIGNFVQGKNALGVGMVYRTDRTPVRQTQQMNLTAGGILAVGKNMGLALVLENIAPIFSSEEARERLLPLTSLGFSYNFGQYARFRFDITSEGNNSWDHPTIAGGIENYLNSWLIFRVGAARDNERREDLYSTGLGFAGPKFGIHYAFQSVNGDTGRDQRHSIDLGVPLW